MAIKVASEYQSAWKSLSVTIISRGESPAKWLVTYSHNEKGATRRVEATLTQGEWKAPLGGPDDAVRALAWIARKLWEEMEARNG